APISRSEVNLIHRPACVCSPILSRMCFGSLSSAPLKNENAHDSLSAITIATFFFRKVKHGLPHLSSSVRPQSSAIWRSLSVSFCHFFAKGTFIVPGPFPRLLNSFNSARKYSKLASQYSTLLHQCSLLLAFHALHSHCISTPQL